jgi:hypothetical protein
MLYSSGPNGSTPLQIISLLTSYYAKYHHKGWQEQLYCMGRIDSHRTKDIDMNQVTPVAKEAPVTFGHVKSQIYMDIYNTRISYPTATILLDLADVKACFRYPRIHADLTGAFIS